MECQFYQLSLKYWYPIQILLDEEGLVAKTVTEKDMVPNLDKNIQQTHSFMIACICLHFSLQYILSLS